MGFSLESKQRIYKGRGGRETAASAVNRIKNLEGMGKKKWSGRYDATYSEMSGTQRQLAYTREKIKKSSRTPVEKWKLTPELLEIEKAYRKRKALSEMLKEGIVLETNKLNVMSQALNKIEGQQEKLIQMVPPERPAVDGVPMKSEDLFQINY